MIKTILHYLAWVAIIGNLILLGLVAFWLIYPYKLPYIEQPIEILNPNKEIAIGEKIVMRINVSKQNDMTPTTAHNLTCEDGNLVTLSSSPKTLQKGQYTIISDRYTLPAKVNKGAICKFNFINNYQLNPLRNETVIWSSENFKVKE